MENKPIQNPDRQPAIDDDIDFEIQQALPESGGKSRSRGRRPRRDPIYEGMIRNIRVFAIVLVTMIVGAAITFLIMSKSDEIQEKKTLEANKNTVSPVLSTEASILLPQKPNTTASRNVRTQVKTESIRKAYTMIKRADAMVENGEFEDAARRYREALEIWPYLTEGREKLGRLYLKQGEYSRAQIALEKAVVNNASAETLNDLAVAYYFQEQYDKALERLETAIEIDPTFASSYFNQVLCHMKNHDPNSAQDCLNQYLKLKPNDPKALKEEAFIQANSGNYIAAMKTLKKALSEAPDWPPLYFDAAATAALLGRLDDTLKYLDKAEALTSPGTVWRIYKKPSFKEIRLTDEGMAFQHELAERMREFTAASLVENSTVKPTTTTTPKDPSSL